MRRSAFTLIEVLISIFITGLIILYLYETVAILNKSDTHLQQQDNNREIQHKIKNLLMLDFMQVDVSATLVSTEDNETNTTKSEYVMYQVPIDINHSRDYDHVTLHTYNSLHNLKVPEVHYLVMKNENTLLRTEWVPQTHTPMQIPLNQESVFFAKHDAIVKNLEYFKVYCAEKKNRLLIAYKQKEKAPFIYELFIPSGSCRQNLE